MEEAGCSLDTEARSGLAKKKKRLSLRGCGASGQSARDASPLKFAGNAVDSKEDLDKGTQQVNTGKDSAGANIERLVDQGRKITATEIGDGFVLLPDDAQTRSGDSEGRQEERVASSLKAKRVIIDEFCDAEEEFPYDVLEEVLSQYDKPLAGERENTKDMAAESLNFSERTDFEEYDVAGGMVEDFKPGGFSRDDEPALIEDESSTRYQDAFDDSSAFRDDLFFDEESRDASIETTLDTRSKADSLLEETACGISDREELSFRDAFYKGGTDWSSLHGIDEYGLPCTSSPPSSYGRDCGSEVVTEGMRNAEPGCMEYKVVKPQSRHSQSSVSEPGLINIKDNYMFENKLNRSGSKLKQGDLSSFLGFKRKSPPDANVSQKRTEQQQDIGTYFGLAPLANQASSAAGSFLQSKFRPGQTPQAVAVAASGEYAPRKGNGNGNGWKSSIRESTRGCPFYKKMPGTPFTVDAFKFGAVEGCKAYFLSHFHADHYGGLTRSWSHGPIFCTEITARLVSMHLGVDSRWLRPVKLNSLFMVESVEVKFLEANHCPGAALILFQTCSGQQRILHTGDFRACKDMQSYPDLLRARVTSLYLDTTYCNPKYNFPLQENVIRHVVRLTTAALARNPRTLVTVGAYSIGKERVYLGIAKALQLKIYADKRRVRTLRALDWPDLTDRLCSDASRSELHVLPISHLNATKLRAYMQSFHPTYNAVLAFRPTGWTYSEKVGSNLEELRPQCSGAVTIYGVPYSEHSSYSELREFVQFLRPQKIIATVNIGSAAQREGMQAHFNQWLK